MLKNMRISQGTITFRQLLKSCVAILLIVAASSASAAKITLNFKEADIKAVITTVAEFTGKNFIIDPRVKGKVTIVSNRSLTKAEVYQVFLSVLEVHGYSAIPSGKIIKIMPDADAKHSGVPMTEETAAWTGDETVTRVIEVIHITAAQLVPILRPLVPPQGHLAAYPQSNVLIISDRAGNIDRLVQIIKRIDQPSSGEVEIIPLQHAAASDLVRVLTTLNQQAQKGAQGAAEKPTLVADERTNSILIGGERAERLQLRAIISHLDTPTEMEGDTHVIYLRYANAKDLVPVLTGVGESAKEAAQGGKGKVAAAAPSSRVDVNIQADENSNALVITAAPSVFRSLEAVIRQLDIRRAQVLIESIIAEVSHAKSAQLGITWLFDGSQSDNPVGAIDFTGTVGGLVAGAATGDFSSALSGGTTLAFGKFNSDSFNWAALVKALKGDSDTNILSTPSLVTLDNEEADIFIGKEVSIPQGSFTNTGGGSTPTNPFTTFERVPIGINLKVKPQINEGSAIRLDVQQAVDSYTGDAGTEGVVTTSRKINTSVMVDNGKVLVLGGLISDEVVESHSKVPFLGDIPILGALFRYESTKKDKTNLMVFLRPVIMRTDADGLMLTNSKYTYMRDLQKKLYDKGIALMPDDDAPVMPEFDGFLELPPAYEEAREQRNQLLQKGGSQAAPAQDNIKSPLFSE